jgi:signal transduction histidine kinase/predicted RNA-binding protein with RPS1 domain/CheY-like chemotaxis protein
VKIVELLIVLPNFVRVILGLEFIYRLTVGKEGECMDWEKIEFLYPKGQHLTGIIDRVELHGAFIDLPEGVPGYIPIKELSWTGSILDAREKLKLGQQIEAVVMKVERQLGNIVLSIREAKGNPWPKFCEIHQKGDLVEGEVIRVFDKAAFIKLSTEIKGVIELSCLWTKVDRMEEALLVGDKVRAKIVEFEKDQQMVLLSVAALFQEDEKIVEGDSGWSIGETVQDAFDLMNFRMRRETIREIGLSEEAKERIRKILVVDPDPEITRSTVEMLESIGFIVQHATSGEEALAKFASETYDLVLTAIGLPGINGITLSQKLFENHSQLPVIFQFSEDLEEHLEHIKKVEFQNCILMKPWQLNDLIKLINDAAVGILGQEPLKMREPEDFVFIDRISKIVNEQTDPKKTVEAILQDLKEKTHASFVVVFQMHLTTLETYISSQVGLNKSLTETERRFLRFSPVMSVIHSKIEIDDDLATGKRYANLRPLGNFKSLIGVKIDFSSDWGYGLFLFSVKESQFTDQDFEKAKIAALILGTAIERHQMEEVCHQQHKFILNGRLASSLVHELKNELQTIFNYIDVLKTNSINLNSGKTKADEKFFGLFQRIVNALLEEQNHIQDIQYIFLNLLKEKNEEQVELLGHLNKLVEIIKPTAEAAKIKIIPPKKQIRKSFLNTSWFDQVITNLLMNAIDQIPLVRKESGEITIRVDFDENSELPIKVRVIDNGPGIHTAYFEKVFDIFFTTKKGGSGLGLFISKALVESLGGKIRIEESIRFGGTTFLVELPFRRKEGM